MRTLIYIPVLHTEADLGTLGAKLRQKVPKELLRELERYRAVTEALWRGVRERLLGLDLPWSEVLIYQDGLPRCDAGREVDIARELAAKGSLNHALLLELLARGGKLVGTEDPALLLRELDHARRLVLAWDGDEAGRRSAVESLRVEAAATLAARDAFIATRIAETLPEGRTGVLFLGGLHRVDELLPEDVVVRTLSFALAPADPETRGAG